MSGRSQGSVDAVLEQAAWVSGINTFDPGELALYEGAKAERLRDLHGPLLDAIAERDAIESEAQMILDVAHNDLKMHSGLDDRAFADFAKQVESGINALWLKRDKDAAGNEVVYVLVPEGQGFRGQVSFSLSSLCVETWPPFRYLSIVGGGFLGPRLLLR